MVRVVLPFQLQTLARSGAEVQLQVEAPVTLLSVITALEARYPMLGGAIIDHNSGRRRPLLRFFACSRDISHDASDDPLPVEVANGVEPLLIVGAIAGG